MSEKDMEMECGGGEGGALVLTFTIMLLVDCFDLMMVKVRFSVELQLCCMVVRSSQFNFKERKLKFPT